MLSVSEALRLEFAQSVVRGLSSDPRRLESRHIYDDHGSRLFEMICEQPEYYLTRAERGILLEAADEISRLTGSAALIEFGSGNSAKTRILLDAYTQRHGEVRYIPVDISDSILDQAKRELDKEVPMATVDSFHGSYEEAFHLFHSFSPMVFLFLGSNIGNLDQSEAAGFWTQVSESLSVGDFCLLGIDITEDPDTLHAAYNDEAGYSASFTKNIFARMNRDLGSSINVGALDHVTEYNAARNQVEIFARFNQPQQIEIESLEKVFQVNENELVMTEISRKFRVSEMVSYLHQFRLGVRQVFTSDAGNFALLLLERR